MPNQPYLQHSGFHRGKRATLIDVNGVGYYFSERQRPWHIASRGDPQDRGMEMTPGGIQATDWEMTLTPGTDGDFGHMEVSTYYFRPALISSRYKNRSLGGPIIKATLTGAQNQFTLAATGFTMPPENSMGASDYVDRIRIERTLVPEPGVVDDFDDGLITDRSLVAGQFYKCAEFSIHAVMDYSDWAHGGPNYAAGDYVKTNIEVDFGNINPDGAITVRYLCLVPHDPNSFGGTAAEDFNDAVEAGYWLPLGGTPIYLRKSDGDIFTGLGVEAEEFWQVPPDTWDAAYVDGAVVMTGQDSYELLVDLTNGSKTVTIAANPDAGTNPDLLRVPDGIILREVQAFDDGVVYSAARYVDEDEFELDRVYEGPTASKRRLLVKHTPGAIWSSYKGTFGPIPDAVPRLAPSLVIYEPNSGGVNEAVAAMPGGGYAVFNATGWGYASQVQNTPLKVEDIPVFTQGKRGIAVGPGGQIFFVSARGIQRITGPQPSERITDERMAFMWDRDSDHDLTWNLDLLAQAVLHYDHTLDTLIMIAPRRGSTVNDLGLIWDRQRNLFWLMTSWEDDEGTLVYENLSAACSIPINGSLETHLAGSLAADLTGDGEIDAFYAGRLWRMCDPDTFRDEIPSDKDGEDTAVSHGIVQRQALWPVSAQRVYSQRPQGPAPGGNRRVEVTELDLEIEPITAGGTFDVVIRQKGHFNDDEEVDATRKGTLRESTVAFDLSDGDTLLETIVLENTARHQGDVITLYQAVIRGNVVSKGR